MPRRLAGERGAVLVTVTLALPVLIGLLAWALDFGNAAVHRRDLQTQADAAALAAAQDLGALNVGCDDAAVRQRAFQYAGAAEYTGAVGGQAAPRLNPGRQEDGGRLPHAVINSPTWFEQPSRTDPTFTAVPPSPCGGVIDLKTTQRDVPRFFPAIPGISFSETLDFINAHARVRLQQVRSLDKLLPVAIPEVAPRRVRATFIDASNGQVVQHADLTETTTSGGRAFWTNAGAPVTVPIDVPNLEVRVALSGTTTIACGNPLVACYDATNGATGLAHVRGVTPTGTPTATPQVGATRLVSGTCSEAYFVSSTAACTVGFEATVSTTDANLQGWAVVGGTSYPLTRNGSSFTGPIQVPTTPGRHTIAFQYARNGCTRTNCRETIGDVQRVFRGSPERSGPVEVVRVAEEGTGQTGAFPRGTARRLVVTIGLQGNLAISKPGDPPVALRVVGGTSRTQALDCDPEQPNLKTELANGCGRTFVRNTGAQCPNTVANTPEPWDCVDVATGTSTNQIPAGMNLRVLGSEKPAACTSPNRWPNVRKGDPRIVFAFLAPYGAFDTSGGGAVPITGFATFYVTGWTGSGTGFGNPCQGNGDDPVPNDDAAVIVGHFVKYVLPGGLSNGVACNPEDGRLDPCVPVLSN